MNIDIRGGMKGPIIALGLAAAGAGTTDYLQVDRVAVANHVASLAEGTNWVDGLAAHRELPRTAAEAVAKLVDPSDRNKIDMVQVRPDGQADASGGYQAWHLGYPGLTRGSALALPRWSAQAWIPEGGPEGASVVVPGDDPDFCRRVNGVANWLVRIDATDVIDGSGKGREMFGDLAENEPRKPLIGIGLTGDNDSARLFRRGADVPLPVTINGQSGGFAAPSSEADAVAQFVPPALRAQVARVVLADPFDQGGVRGFAVVEIHFRDGTTGSVSVPADWGGQAWVGSKNASVVVPGRANALVTLGGINDVLLRTQRHNGVGGEAMGRIMFGDLGQNEPNTDIAFGIVTEGGQVRGYQYAGTMPLSRQECPDGEVVTATPTPAVEPTGTQPTPSTPGATPTPCDGGAYPGPCAPTATPEVTVTAGTPGTPEPTGTQPTPSTPGATPTACGEGPYPGPCAPTATPEVTVTAGTPSTPKPTGTQPTPTPTRDGRVSRAYLPLTFVEGDPPTVEPTNGTPTQTPTVGLGDVIVYTAYIPFIESN